MIWGYPFVQQPPDPAFQQIFQELAQAGNAPNASRLGHERCSISDHQPQKRSYGVHFSTKHLGLEIFRYENVGYLPKIC